MLQLEPLLLKPDRRPADGLAQEGNVLRDEKKAERQANPTPAPRLPDLDV
jgi:hypothetical protein